MNSEVKRLQLEYFHNALATALGRDATPAEIVFCEQHGVTKTLEYIQKSERKTSLPSTARARAAAAFTKLFNETRNKTT